MIKRNLIIFAIIIVVVILIWIAYDGYIPIKIEQEFTAEVCSITGDGYTYNNETIDVSVSGTRRLKPLRDDVFVGKISIGEQTFSYPENSQGVILDSSPAIYRFQGSAMYTYALIDNLSFNFSRFALKIMSDESDNTLVLCNMSLEEYREEIKEQ